MKEEIPARGLQLRSLVTEDLTVEVSLVEVAVPSPGPDEVLVRVEAAPINPSDLGVLFAGADIAAAEVSGTPDRPVITAPLCADAARAAEARVGQSMPVGNEGAGTVVAAGETAAPRGANREKALRVISDRPGVTHRRAPQPALQGRHVQPDPYACEARASRAGRSAGRHVGFRLTREATTRTARA